MLEISGSDMQFYLFNFLVTDNEFVSDYYSNPIALTVITQFINIFKTNFVVLFNKRINGSYITNIAAYKSEGLVFSINGVNFFKRILKYRD